MEQIGNAVRFLAFFTANKQGATGLAVTVDVYSPSGSQVVTDASATEVGSGLYAYILASGSVTVEGEYVAVFKTADATVDIQHIPSLWSVGRAGVEHLDSDISDTLQASSYTVPATPAAIADAVLDEQTSGHLTAGSVGAKLNSAASAGDPLTNPVPGSYESGTAGHALGRIGTAEVSVVSPVSESGDITIVSGDSYVSSKGTALSWTSADFPDLTGATLSFAVDTLEATPVCSNPGEAEQTITLQLTAEETATLRAATRAYTFDIEASYSGGIVITLLGGMCTVLPD